MAASKALAILFAALMVSAVLAKPLPAPHGRRLMATANDDFDGGITTANILAENDAKGGTERALEQDQVHNTYQIQQGSYRDVYGATYSDDNNGQFFALTQSTGPAAGR